VFILIALSTGLGLLLALTLIELNRIGYYAFTPAVQEYIDPNIEIEQSVAPSPFLREEEAFIIASTTHGGDELLLSIDKLVFEYVEVIDGCGPYFEGECLNVRSGPGTDYPVVKQLRNGIVLKVGGRVVRDGRTWYKIVFDEYLYFPERIKGDWYIAAEYVTVLLNEGDRMASGSEIATGTKQIIVNRADQMLYAYDEDRLFMKLQISTGLELSPTPAGEFTIFKKTPSRYMQGPVPGLTFKYYDLPGVPWNLYFTHGGAVIHGTYWHNKFGNQYSNGCVNLPPDAARKLYMWADIGTRVIVKD
jgi:hypothetical protein